MAAQKDIPRYGVPAAIGTYESCRQTTKKRSAASTGPAPIARKLPLSTVIEDAERLTAQHDTLITRAKAGEVIDAKVIAEAEAAARAWAVGRLLAY